jgi:outer membrane biosynthesis protein TonB
LKPVAAAGVAVLLALWIGTRLFHSRAGVQSAAAVQSAPQQPAISAAQVPATPAPGSSVLHQEIPAVSRGAIASIHGQVKVAVRVTVDRSGNVVGENIEARGSSRYFARLSAAAAKKWKFAPANDPSPREWTVEFEFARDGVGAQAIARGKP